MWFSKKQVVKSAPDSVAQVVVAGAGKAAPALPMQITTKSRGDAAESAARAYLVCAGLKFIEANYRTPGRGGGEIDLVMRASDGTLVFVEVRQRSGASHGGAAASIGVVKQRRIVFAARHYLMRFASLPPCRFDVVLVQGALREEESDARIEWLPAAFDAS
jgi:putative endonuclease